MIISEYILNPLGFLLVFVFLASIDILLAPDYEYSALRLRALLSANFIFFTTGCIFYFHDAFSDNIFFSIGPGIL